jgi:hypothetical protein
VNLTPAATNKAGIVIGLETAIEEKVGTQPTEQAASAPRCLSERPVTNISEHHMRIRAATRVE